MRRPASFWLCAGLLALRIGLSILALPFIKGPSLRSSGPQETDAWDGGITGADPIHASRGDQH